MEKQQVEIFVAANAEKLPSALVVNVKEALEKADESKTALVQALELKSPTTMLIIAWLGGSLGIDRFLLGDTGLAVAKLLTCGGCGIWTLIDLFSVKDRTRQYNYKKLQEVLL